MKLTKIDLRRGVQKGDQYVHPDINCRASYLCLIDGEFFAGKFSREWYGLNFLGWGGCGLQFDEAEEWEGVWKIERNGGRG